MSALDGCPMSGDFDGTILTCEAASYPHPEKHFAALPEGRGVVRWDYINRADYEAPEPIEIALDALGGFLFGLGMAWEDVVYGYAEVRP